MSTDPPITRADRRTSLDTPGSNATTPIATPSLGAAEVLVVRQEQAPGGANPPHTKSREALVLVLDGRVTVEVDGTQHELGADDSIVVPAGAVNRTVNAGPTPARWLVVTAAPVTFASPDGTPVEPAWAR